MMHYYQKLLEYLANGTWDPGVGSKSAVGNPQSGIRILNTMSLKSWPIPVRVKKSLFHNGRVVVAGDAAGLTDPLTGEGIYYAIRSGLLAAKCCHSYLLGETSSLESYTKLVNEELMGELLEANRIKNLFNTVPLKIHHFVRDSDRAWLAFGKILRGERGYADVPAGFGKWKILWGLVCFFSKWISHIKENRFSKNGFKQG